MISTVQSTKPCQAGEEFKRKFCDPSGDCIRLSETEFDLLSKTVTYRTLNKNDYFLKEGESCSEIAFVGSGMLRHFYFEPGGDITNWMALPGTFSTSLTSFITGELSIENIQAVEFTELYCIPKSSWLKVSENSPALLELWRKKIESMYLFMEERVYHFISKTGEQRYDFFCRRFPELVRSVPLKYIASMLGMEPRHLSRIRKARKLAHR